MKKPLYILMTMLLLSQAWLVQAEKITEKQAARVARNFYYERAALIKEIELSSISPTLIYTEKDHSFTYYYIFSINTGGFVIVSGTDAAVPVLGYSFDSEVTDQLPENFKGWMDHYKDEIADCGTRELVNQQENQEEWQRLLSATNETLKPNKSLNSVAPLITSNWDQGKFYNAQCPADPLGPAGHCVTGCVATAMGMILYYYRFPTTGTGSYTYTHPDYGTLSADFGSATYNWNGMANAATTWNPEIAQLLYHMGVSVDMDYGPDGSGMWNHKAAYSLRTYFKSVPQTRYLFRDSTNLDWDSIIVRHIDRKQIMYYAGWAAVGSTSGHAFIVDGYQDSTYFHFNWGWSASYNGYFYLNSLNPGGNNFNYAQELILNIYPDTTQYTYPYYCNGSTTIHSLTGTLEDGSGPTRNYLNNADCGWLLDPQVNPDDSIKNILITFNKFDTEPGNDLVRIYDGADANAPLLATYSGNTIPLNVTTTGNKAFIRFTTNDSINKTGWLLSYKANFPKYCQSTTTLTSPQGTITDGSEYKHYNDNTQCSWIINPPFAGQVNLTFTSFDVEPSLDYVKVYDYNTQALLGTYSGNTLPPPISSIAGGMYIVFKTNDLNYAGGWSADYSVTNVGLESETTPSWCHIFPNPATDMIYLDIFENSKLGYELTVNTLAGEKVMQKHVDSSIIPSRFQFDTKTLTPGIYFVRLTSALKNYVGKLVISK